MTDEREPVPWESELLGIVAQFGEDCARLRNSNPYADVEAFPTLRQIIVYLAMELWDQNFSIAEITSAFSAVINDIPRYANGYNRRSDESQAKRKPKA